MEKSIQRWKTMFEFIRDLNRFVVVDVASSWRFSSTLRNEAELKQIDRIYYYAGLIFLPKGLRLKRIQSWKE